MKMESACAYIHWSVLQIVRRYIWLNLAFCPKSRSNVPFSMSSSASWAASPRSPVHRNLHLSGIPDLNFRAHRCR